MGASAPDSVKRLVDIFDRERRVYQSPDYKEEQLRAESGPRPSIRHSYFVIWTCPGMPVIHAANGSQLTAYSLWLSDSDSGRSATSRWPLALANGSLYYPDCPYGEMRDSGAVEKGK
jgi:hypothetical protein